MPNVFIHLISFLMFWLSPILGILIHPLFWIGFFASGLVGTAGHYFFKDGTVDAKEATSSLQVVHFSSVMAFLFVLGKWPKEIKTTDAKYKLFLEGKIGSVADKELFGKLRNTGEALQ